MNPILNYINRKNYNIFESIQLLHDMDCYGNMDNIFKELKDIMPDKIHISTEGIEDEKILFLLNELNGCSLKSDDKYYWIIFIKDDRVLFRWDLEYDSFWVDYGKIWGIFEKQNKMSDYEIRQFIKNVLEQYCKIMVVTAV